MLRQPRFEHDHIRPERDSCCGQETSFGDESDGVGSAVDRVSAEDRSLGSNDRAPTLSYFYNYTDVPYQVNPYQSGRGPQSGCESFTLLSSSCAHPLFPTCLHRCCLPRVLLSVPPVLTRSDPPRYPPSRKQTTGATPRPRGRIPGVRPRSSTLSTVSPLGRVLLLETEGGRLLPLGCAWVGT